MEEKSVQDGVVVPPLIVAGSDAMKKKRKQSLTQLPVYRAAGNLMYLLFSAMITAPRKATKFLDLMLESANGLLNAIGMADKARTGEERAVYIDTADVMVRNLGTCLKALSHARVAGHSVGDDGRVRVLPVIGKGDCDKMNALMGSIVSQLVAWRNSAIKNEGVNENSKENDKQSVRS